MSKRVLVLAAAVLLLTLWSGTAAAACPADQYVSGADALIERSVERARFLANQTPRKDEAIAAHLVQKTERIVERCDAVLGEYTLEHVYVDVVVGDVTVSVDPMKVAGS